MLPALLAVFYLLVFSNWFSMCNIETMPTKMTKRVIILILVAVCAVSWWYAISTYRDNRSEIALSVADITRELALPYRMARLSSQEPAEELPVPVYNVYLRNIEDTWGAAREEGRTHEGVDIFADRGTPVFSSTEGYVIRVNIGSRGGKNVMVTGPGGFNYYYAHFQRVAEGVERGKKVTTDTVLGFVGNSGNATGTPPHLHFGIYPEMWDAVNPYPMLVDRWGE